MTLNTISIMLGTITIMGIMIESENLPIIAFIGLGITVSLKCLTIMKPSLFSSNTREEK